MQQRCHRTSACDVPPLRSTPEARWPRPGPAQGELGRESRGKRVGAGKSCTATPKVWPCPSPLSMASQATSRAAEEPLCLLAQRGGGSARQMFIAQSQQWQPSHELPRATSYQLGGLVSQAGRPSAVCLGGPHLPRIQISCSFLASILPTEDACAY